MDDKNLEIRILATEYLGLMRSKRAVPKLIQLIEAGNPKRLRLASVDALGEIADPRASKPLLAVLGSGSESLYHPAASALIYIGDIQIVPDLLRVAKNPKAPARHHAVRALGGILRDRPHADARELLMTMADKESTLLALSAIEALGAMGDKNALAPLRELAKGGGHRRRAAITALGNLGDRGATAVLLEALASGDDRVSGDAAWALGKLRDPRALDALVRVVQARGWSTPINASAAVARYATASHGDKLIEMLYHRSRFVRANAAMALGRLKLARAGKALSLALQKDDSWWVRIAACRALSRIGAGKEALAAAAKDDREEAVRNAAAAALAGPFELVERSDWRHFYFVDPDLDTPVRQEPYFSLTADGLATALYTDARGIATEEQFPPGDAILAPQSTASRY